MNVEKKLNGEELTLIVSGRLDTQTAPELEKELNDVLSGVKELVFKDNIFDKDYDNILKI